ncbi:hypothetical protein [Pseudomonas protegens]|uniref:hypothetical protein n=2 Tax=Pseudomonas protegens TaxID=380021 RepID=UPI001B30B77B|nr:hypothetical protein [Pseudomonas protegens]MBP5099540.1 hypothetical protein [Pseudomonas protegens]QTU05507.1 hypothetical protein HUT25_06965 [Pseudomonas protegens]QTU11818.1 hypothetical protein HUT23_07655 [Pseudomonas protegens]QTU40804.1 hypothetical protein HUT24_24645 [Pseudomonas protegens]
MAIPNDVLQQVRDNPVEGGISVCRFALKAADSDNNYSGNWTEEDHGVLLEAAAILLHLEEQELISHLVVPPDVDSGMEYVCGNLRKFLQDVQHELIGQTSASKLDSLKKQFAVTLTNGFGYEFTDGDLKRIQQLINELREMVSANTELDAGHKQRMLKRLEKMQSELHKKMSDISRFYELMGDAGVALGKLGEGAKPFVDRIKEIVDIGWKSQARAEQLQSDAENPMLGHESEPKLLD